ncbi:MAG: ABC transporter ATP-binding protein, partial [Candidatus Saccharimonadaceae bacterium]
MSKGKSKAKLSIKQRIKAMANVGSTAFRASPSAVIIKLFGAVVVALLPIVTAYYAALTTTALAEGYSGNQQAGNQAITYVLITAGLGVLLTVWSSIERYINSLTNYKIEAAVTDRLYEHFASIDYWRYDEKETADLFDKAQNFSMFFARFFDTIGRIVTALVQVFVGVGALFFVSWWLGLIVVVAVVPGMIIQLRLSRLQSEHWKSNVEKRRKVNGISYSVFQTSNLAELRVYNTAKYMLNLRAKLRDEDEMARIGFEKSFVLKRLGADIIEAGAEVIALVYIAVQIINRSQPIGQFIYVQQLVSRALGGMNGFISEISQIDEDLATMYDYEQFMALPESEEGKQPLRSRPEIIEVKNLSFRYPNSETDVLKNVSLTIGRNQHIAIVGENGAGKSTLIKLIMGLYQAQSGAVLIDGVNLNDINKTDWHKQLGVLQQSFMHYHFATAKENVIYGDVDNPEDRDRLNQAIEMAEARKFIAKLPKGEDSYVNQWFEHSDGTPGTELSGGQWQRLALARNFYRDAPIIILDEPTSAIDALAESRIFDRLFSAKNKTIVAISHRLTTIEKADIVYMMKDGSIVEHGS